MAREPKHWERDYLVLDPLKFGLQEAFGNAISKCKIDIILCFMEKLKLN